MLSRGIGPTSLNLLDMLCLRLSIQVYSATKLLATFTTRAHCWFMVNLMSSTIPKSCSAKLLSSQSATSMYCCIGLFLPGCRTWHFPLLNFETPVCSFLQPVLVPLNDSKTIWSLSHSSQFRTIFKLLEDVLCSTVQVVNEEVSVDPSIDSWWTQLVAGLQLNFLLLVHNPLSLAVQSIFSPAHCPLSHLCFISFSRRIL